ncbi:outer membrane lipoprotein carrier protein LolA [Candidatus Latescibacterota bacterium]
MNRFYRLSLKTFLTLFEFCGIIIALSGATIATEQPGYTPEEVLIYINETYQKVKSAEGVILRTKGVGNEEHQRFTGRFAVKKPDRLFVEYVGDLQQFTVYDGKTFRIYFPDENRGLYRETQNLS